MNTDPRTHSELHALLEGWAALWGVPDLAQAVGVRVSKRLRRSLGTYRPSSQQITLAAWLLDEAPRSLLEEVLCHEAAHAAVHLTEAAPAEREATEAGGGVAAEGAPSESRMVANADRRGAVGAEADASAKWPRGVAGPLTKLRERFSRRALEERSRPSGRSGGRAARKKVRSRAGARVRPHGAEWRAFMEAAGFPARVRIPEELMPESIRAANRASRKWEHRCPVCQATRMARTRVTRWRCRRCVEDGRSGRLVIGRVGELFSISVGP
ncbi:MAG: SprT-like domain-containing protein [Myxococcota bacterium]